jgi:hypothetical protein
MRRPAGTPPPLPAVSYVSVISFKDNPNKAEVRWVASYRLMEVPHMRNKSGYDRVVDNIMKLDELDVFFEEHKRRIEDPRLVGHSFTLDHQNQTQAHFTIQFGDDPIRVLDDGTQKVIESKKLAYTVTILDGTWRLPRDAAASNFMKGLIKAVWKTPRCRTYNCNKSRAEDAAATELASQAPSPDNDPRALAYEQIDELKATPEWKHEFQTFINKNSKEAIIQAMRRFPNVSDDVFEEALREFVAERVIED